MEFFGQEVLELDFGVVHRYINFLVEEWGGGGTDTFSRVCISFGVGRDMPMYSRSNSDLATYVSILLLLPSSF